MSQLNDQVKQVVFSRFIGGKVLGTAWKGMNNRDRASEGQVFGTGAVPLPGHRGLTVEEMTLIILQSEQSEVSE